MEFARGIRHLLLGTLACLLVIALSATYWAISGRDSLLLRPDNPRAIETLAAIHRGGIFDRNLEPLVETTDQKGALARRYLRPATYSAIGYYSLRYGVSGAESAFDDLLSGSSEIENIHEFVNRRLLNRPQVGSDIRLTIDAELQAALFTAMGDARGATVVLDARSGEVLALISLPTYDPNTLDEDWQNLIEAEGQPFFNRALQGQYQLGGAMYTVWLAHAAAAAFDLAQPIPQAAMPIEFEDGMTLACLVTPKQSALSLIDAYAYSCPGAFQSYFLQDNAIKLDSVIAPYNFGEPVALAGFPRPEPVVLPVAPTANQLDSDALALRGALGQGDVTASPLHLAAIMAAVATDGSVKQPFVLSAARRPGAHRWQDTPMETNPVPAIDAEVARQMRELLRRSWSTLQGDLADPEVGAQVASSQSGESSQIWLNGFITESDEAAYSFIILLENSDDLSRLLTIGQALSGAIDRLQ